MITWLKSKLNRPQNADSGRLDLSNPETWEDVLGGLRRTYSGKAVNETTAMKVSAVYACVRLISGAISTAPMVVYQGERTGGSAGYTPAPNHPLAPVLRLRPNPIITACTFWRSMVLSKLLHGNAYAVIGRDRMGRPSTLSYVRPYRVNVYQAWELGLDAKISAERERLYYLVTMDHGNQIMLDQDDVLHVPGVGWDGKRGLSTLAAGAEAMGLAMAEQEHGARFFGQGASFNFAIQYPRQLSEDGVKLLRDYWTRRHAGVGNSHIPPILTEGGEIQPFSMSARDAQLLESRQFSVIDVCRFFGVPPVMIGETEKTSSWGSGVESMGRWFVTYALNDHLTAIEQEVERKLFSGDSHFAEFDESEMTRGDVAARYASHRIARGNMQEPGFKTVNEIRAEEGLPPIEGGDELQRPEPAKGQNDEQ